MAVYCSSKCNSISHQNPRHKSCTRHKLPLRTNSFLNPTRQPPHRPRPSLLRTLPLAILRRHNLGQIALTVRRRRRQRQLSVTRRRRLRALPLVKRIAHLARFRRRDVARLYDLAESRGGGFVFLRWRGRERWQDGLGGGF